MREYSKIVLLLIFSLCSYTLVAQEIESEFQKEKNGVFCSIGAFRISGYTKNTKDFAPSLEIGYNRLLFKNTYMGLVYSHKKVSELSYHTTGEEIPYMEKDNALLATINYKIPIYNFYIMPSIALGACYAHIALSDSGLIAQSYRFAKYPGVTIGYCWKHWDTFLSYRYEFYKYNVNFKSSFIATWTFPSVFVHHMFRLGCCYKF